MGRQWQIFSVELFLQLLSKQQAFHFLTLLGTLYVTFTLKTCIWLDQPWGFLWKGFGPGRENNFGLKGTGLVTTLKKAAELGCCCFLRD